MILGLTLYFLTLSFIFVLGVYALIKPMGFLRMLQRVYPWNAAYQREDTLLVRSYLRFCGMGMAGASGYVLMKVATTITQ